MPALHSFVGSAHPTSTAIEIMSHPLVLVSFKIASRVALVAVVVVGAFVCQYLRVTFMFPPGTAKGDHTVVLTDHGWILDPFSFL